MICDHSFVTYVGGDEPYECGDCGILLSAVPTEAPKTPLKIPSDVRQAFMDGMITLGEAAQATNVTMKKFAETCRELFVETPIFDDMYQLGKKKPFAKAFMGMEPQRTSCPLEIDEFFSGNPIVDGIGNAFYDISTISHNMECESGFDAVEAQYSIEFIDGSVQKVIG